MYATAITEYYSHTDPVITAACDLIASPRFRESTPNTAGRLNITGMQDNRSLVEH